MTPAEPCWQDREIAAIRTRLLDFFDEHRRPLPWRDEPSPYGILVSEVMSQQTRLDTVVPYFRRWMERFPDTAALAEADTEEVLSLWQGLGYYSRARNLHRAVREVEERYGGEVPSDPGELRSLPGVGPYTAGAVASIAFGVPAPAVDGNVRRVMARLLDVPRPTPTALESWAGELVDPDRPGDFNQALMELGSLVCTPRDPECDACPVAELCRARAAGTAQERPLPKVRASVPSRHEGVLVLARRDGSPDGGPSRSGPPGRGHPGGWELLMRRRPDEGLLAGMWEFPGSRCGGRNEAEAAAREVMRGAAVQRVGAASRAGTVAVIARPCPLSAVPHTFSHLKVTYHPFLGVIRNDGCAGGSEEPRRSASEASTAPPVPGVGARPTPLLPDVGARPGPSGDAGIRDTPGTETRWVGPGELDSLPLPVAQRKILTAALSRLSGPEP